jgi:hypothetical protein
VSTDLDSSIPTEIATLFALQSLELGKLVCTGFFWLDCALAVVADIALDRTCYQE